MRARCCWIGLSFLMLAIAGCGVSSPPGTATSGSPSGTLGIPTNTPGFVTTPTLQTTPIPGFAPCNPSLFANATRVGDILVTSAEFANLANPSFQVPDNTPLKPLEVNDSSPTPFGRPADTNPGMHPHSGGYWTAVCNGSKTQAHTISSVSARLNAFTPYSGQLNVWDPCSGAYINQTGQVTGGCGGSYFADYFLLATFAPTAPTGAVVTTTVGASNSGNQPPYQTTPLPITLTPNQEILIEVVIKPPTAAGAYTFGFGLTIDSAASVFASQGPSTLLAPVAHTWTGKACLAPAMKSQIPTSSPADYICPES